MEVRLKCTAWYRRWQVRGGTDSKARDPASHYISWTINAVGSRFAELAQTGMRPDVTNIISTQGGWDGRDRFAIVGGSHSKLI